jgi:hypothetical protein
VWRAVEKKKPQNVEAAAQSMGFLYIAILNFSSALTEKFLFDATTLSDNSDSNDSSENIRL